jgi:hypothetical protein
MLVPVQVSLEGSPSQGERDAVLRALQDGGFEPSSLTGVTRGTADTVAAVVIVAPLAEFFKTLGSQAGGDAMRAIKGLFGRVRDARGGDAAVRLEDAGAGPIVHLDSSLPDDAYRTLAGYDWSNLGDGDLSWDAATRSWRLVD